MADQIAERHRNLIRSVLEEQDRKTLENRIDRWLSGGSYYSEQIQVLVDCFYDEAFKMFVQGHFVGTILLCAFVTEAVLRTQTGKKGNARLEELAKDALERGLINDEQKQSIDWLRKLRNAIAHADPGSLSTFERHPKGPYEPPLADFEKIDAAYGYFKLKRGLEQDAQGSLQCALELVKLFYRTQ